MLGQLGPKLERAAAWKCGLPKLWNQGDRKMKTLRKMIKNNKGATAIEYGLIAALIAVAAITAMQGLGNNLKNTFNTAANKMATA
jgi:pilus assembly protein Flp/PilA